MDCFLIDAYNLAFRCFYAMPDLSRSDGFPTGALHAFFASILKLTSLGTPHATAVFFDKGGSSRHRGIFPEYKANRSEAPESFRLQVPHIKHLCEIFGFSVSEHEGIEADDLLGSCAARVKESGASATIVSADKDFAQLVSPGIRQLLPPSHRSKDWVEMDSIGVKVKFGVPPSKIPDLLALTGDNADNIPGVAGVGLKTAAKWLKDYGDLGNIIKRHYWLKPEKFRDIIRDSEEILHRNLNLVTIDTSIDVPPPSPNTPDFPEIAAFLEKMEMKKSLSALRNFAHSQYQTDV